MRTCGYAPASARAGPQLCSNTGPLAPRDEMTTSPPAARMLLMLVWSWPPVSGRPPSHIGLQVPLVSMNAIVNHLTPVADMTVRGSGGLPQPRYRYGAAAWAPTGGGGGGVGPVGRVR